MTREQIRSTLSNWQPNDTPARLEGDWSRDVTIMATTFERPRCVLRLLQSIRRFYPTIPVLVCDTSPEPMFPEGAVINRDITWLTPSLKLGHTVGASRNHLINHAQTEFFFLADDDHVFNEHTDLEAMYRFLKRHQFDLVGGRQGKGDYGTAIFEQEGGIVYQHFYRHHGLVEPGVVRCDRVSNTYLARTEAVRQVLWEHRVYANEHAEFFLRASRQRLKIAQMGSVYVDHKRDCEQATGVIGKLLGWLLPHRDRKYHNLMVDADNIRGTPSKRARELERKYCFEKNGIKQITSVSHHMEKVKLQKLLSARSG